MKQLKDAGVWFVGADMGGDKTIVVLSLEPSVSKGMVRVNVDFERDENVEAVEIYGKNGELIPASFKKIENQFVYTLPKDRFRQPKYGDRFEIEFPVQTNGIGFGLYKVCKANAAPKFECPIKIFENGMENENLRVEFRPDGAFDLTDNRTGKTFFNQNRIEDQPDIGESYNFKAGGQAVLCNCAEVSLYKTTPYSATYRTVAVLASDAVVSSYITLTKGIDRMQK